jgi:hypothetical protein
MGSVGPFLAGWKVDLYQNTPAFADFACNPVDRFKGPQSAILPETFVFSATLVQCVPEVFDDPAQLLRTSFSRTLFRVLRNPEFGTM